MVAGHLSRAAVVLMLVLAIGAAAQAAAAPASGKRVIGLERQLIAAVNDARAMRGLQPLNSSPGLRVAALRHSRNMVAYGFFAHESPDGEPFSERLKQAYPPRPDAAWTVGENLYASSVAPTAEQAVKAWLASPPHRGILLSRRYRDLGLGVIRSALAGGDFGDRPTWVITADFGARTR
jgi:uncharacterized protein YkwD